MNENESDEQPLGGFLESYWVKQGENPEADDEVRSKFPGWLSKMKNGRLAEEAAELWRMWQAGEVSRTDVALVIAALLYCISPLDLTPDFIPVVGFLDDLIVVTGVLAYLRKKRGKINNSTIPCCNGETPEIK